MWKKANNPMRKSSISSSCDSEFGEFLNGKKQKANRGKFQGIQRQIMNSIQSTPFQDSQDVYNYDDNSNIKSYDDGKQSKISHAVSMYESEFKDKHTIEYQQSEVQFDLKPFPKKNTIDSPVDKLTQFEFENDDFSERKDVYQKFDFTNHGNKKFGKTNPPKKIEVDNKPQTKQISNFYQDKLFQQGLSPAQSIQSWQPKVQIKQPKRLFKKESIQKEASRQNILQSSVSQKSNKQSPEPKSSNFFAKGGKRNLQVQQSKSEVQSDYSKLKIPSFMQSKQSNFASIKQQPKVMQVQPQPIKIVSKNDYFQKQKPTMVQKPKSKPDKNNKKQQPHSKSKSPIQLAITSFLETIELSQSNIDTIEYQAKLQNKYKQIDTLYTQSQNFFDRSISEMSKIIEQFSRKNAQEQEQEYWMQKIIHHYQWIISKMQESTMNTNYKYGQ